MFQMLEIRHKFPQMFSPTCVFHISIHSQNNDYLNKEHLKKNCIPETHTEICESGSKLAYYFHVKRLFFNIHIIIIVNGYCFSIIMVRQVSLKL